MTLNKDRKNFKLDVPAIKKLVLNVGVQLLKDQKNCHNLKTVYKEKAGMQSSADVKSEKVLMKELHKIFPQAEFLAEESTFVNAKNDELYLKQFKDKEWVWAIDPLDGTNNFLCGLDYFAICIALIHQGETIFGMVYRPSHGECFWALKGAGAYFEILGKASSKKKLFYRPKKKIALKDSMLVTGFTSEKGTLFEREFLTFKNMMGECRGIRRMGSAALDMCYVVTGIFGGFWERGLAPWDISASALIASESGHHVSSYDGKKFHPFLDTILVCKPELKSKFIKLIKQSSI